jgi:hypothetical protein
MLKLKAFGCNDFALAFVSFLRLVSSFARDRTGWDFCSKSGGVNLPCTVLVGGLWSSQGEDDEGEGKELLLMQRVISISLG